MEALSGFIDKSIKFVGVLNDSDKKHRQLVDFVPFAVSELQHLKRVIQTCRPTDDDHLQCWVNDQALIASRIEDLVDLYNLTIHKQQTEWTGVYFVLRDLISKPYEPLFGAMEEVKQLITESNRRVESYKLGSEVENLLGSGKEPFSHAKEAYPVGLDKAIEDVLIILFPEPKDLKTKILSIFGAGGTGKSILADVIFDEVKKGRDECGVPSVHHFAWVKVSGVGDPSAMFQQIIEQIGLDKPPISIDLSKFLKKELRHKRLSKVPRFVCSSNVSELQLCSMEPGSGASLLKQLKAMKMLKYLRIKEKYTPFTITNMFTVSEELVFTDKDFKSLKHLCLDMFNAPKMHFQGPSNLESIELICMHFGGVYGLQKMKLLEQFILSDDVSGENRLSVRMQLHQHPRRPKFIRTPAPHAEVHQDPPTCRPGVSTKIRGYSRVFARVR